MVKDVCTVGAEVPMNDKYLSKDFEGNLSTQTGIRTTASRMVFLPKSILMLLIALLACLSSHVPKTFAEKLALMSAGIGRTDQKVKEMGVAKMPEDQHAEQFSKALDLDSLIKAS